VDEVARIAEPFPVWEMSIPDLVEVFIPIKIEMPSPLAMFFTSTVGEVLDAFEWVISRPLPVEPVCVTSILLLGDDSPNPTYCALPAIEEKIRARNNGKGENWCLKDMEQQLVSVLQKLCIFHI
jgi:hypothetical protein